MSTRIGTARTSSTNVRLMPRRSRLGAKPGSAMASPATIEIEIAVNDSRTVCCSPPIRKFRLERPDGVAGLTTYHPHCWEHPASSIAVAASAHADIRLCMLAAPIAVP